MKRKNGRDFVELENCVVSVEPDGKVRISTMSETIEVSAKEWAKLAAFVATRHNAELCGGTSATNAVLNRIFTGENK